MLCGVNLLLLLLATVPQLSKCLKFDAIRGDQTDQRICIQTKRYKRPMRVLLFREWLTIIISFI